MNALVVLLSFALHTYYLYDIRLITTYAIALIMWLTGRPDGYDHSHAFQR